MGEVAHAPEQPAAMRGVPRDRLAIRGCRHRQRDSEEPCGGRTTCSSSSIV